MERTLVTKPCLGCGEPISKIPSKIDSYKYCSRKCRPLKVTRYTCEVCGSERTIQTSQGRKRFCSNKCRLAWFSTHFRGASSPHWKGGKAGYYGPNWYSQRAKAIRRDGRTCRHCGADGKLPGVRIVVAHIEPFEKFGPDRCREGNRLANLLTLCHPCHLVFDWANGTRRRN